MTEGSPEIRPLDQQTVERIAAGEVVERPASAVKELLENSIDADASRVTVAVEAGGTGGITISDDGIGMDESALRRAVQEHTTSKIRDIDDLEAGVGTLGFRGEALHAIGAVSRMTITSRPRGGDVGTELTVEGGEVVDVSPAGCPEGTTVAVEDLFYNVPARRKYLKQETTEFAHVTTVVRNYALANPDVAITLTHDGRETFATPGTGDLQAAMLAVYGREVAGSMISVDLSGADLPDGPLDGVRGAVSHPETNRASREYLSTFVNGRYVKSGTVRDAIVSAYGGQLASDRFPFAVVFLELDPGVVDVNVHPRKLEVRFAADAAVHDQVDTAIEDALLSEGLLRSSAPRGRSAPEQTEVVPERDESDEPDGEVSQTEDGRDQSGTSGAPEAHESSDTGGVSPTDAAAGGGPRGTVDGSTIATEPSAETPTSSPRDASVEERPASEAESSQGPEPPTASEISGQSSPSRTGRKFRATGDQVALDGEVPTVEFDRLPALRILGQLHDTYIVAETHDGLILIDQHAADERINYERLQEEFQGDTTTQALAEPVELELTAGEAAVFDAYADALARLGFHAEDIDDRRLRVATVPAVVADAAGPALLRDVLADAIDPEATANRTVEAVADDVLADLACYPSVTGNTSLTEGSVRELLSALDACENPWACPHGRPVLIHLDSEEIEHRFERDYPGH